MSGWEPYIQNIMNKWTKKDNNFSVSDVCCYAAIIGLDNQQVWAQSKEWPGLKSYDHDLDTDDGSKKVVKIDEFQICIAASNGNRNPTAAGIRFAGQKFMMISADDETKTAYLSRSGGGGATICRTNKALVIGVWDKFKNTSKGLPQVAGDCSETVERVAKFMREQGF